MSKRILICIACALIILLGLQGCKNDLKKAENSTSISDEVWCNPLYLPEDIDQTRVKMLNIPGYQQYVYQSSDATNRVVIDIQTEKNILVEAENKSEIDIGPNKGVYYVYNGETINYIDLTEAITSRLTKIALGEIVFEWEQTDGFCRVFGTYPLDEMEKIVENLEVNIYE